MPTWSQVGSPNRWICVPTWMKNRINLSIDFKCSFKAYWVQILMILECNMTWPRARLYCKLQYKIDIFMFCLMCCSIDLFVVFWLIFVRLGGQKPTKNRAKIDQKSDAKQDAFSNAFWVALGGHLGSKMAPSWQSNGNPKPPKTHPKRHQKTRPSQSHAGNPDWMQVLCKKGSLPSLK